MVKKPPYIYRAQVRFSHTDPAGYVFFPRFFEMFQSAVEDWFYHGLEINYAEMFQKGRALPTASTQSQFFKPCKLGDTLEISVVLETVGTSSLSVRFVGRVGGEVHLEASSVLVVINTQDGRPVPIDDDLRGRLNWYVQE